MPEHEIANSWAAGLTATRNRLSIISLIREMPSTRSLKAAFWRGKRIRKKKKKRKRLPEKLSRRTGAVLIEPQGLEDGEGQEDLEEAVWQGAGIPSAPGEARKDRPPTTILRERAHIGAVHTQICCPREELADGVRADTVTNEVDGAPPEEESHQERPNGTLGANSRPRGGVSRRNGGERKRT